MKRCVIVIVAMGFLLGGCNSFSSAYTYRYRITVEVDTPQGLRTESSVWETSAWEGSGIPDTAIRSSVRGEAVAVDLPGGTLFALLRGQDMDVNYSVGLVSSQLRQTPVQGVTITGDWKQNRRQIASRKPGVTLTPDLYPLLVRFRDLSSPASVATVDPAALAASFGPGVRLRRIVVQVTDERVTEGIENRLPWLPSQRGMLVVVPLDTPKSAGPFSSLLTEGDFVRS